MKENYKSDLCVRVQLKLGGVNVSVPSHDFMLRFYTVGSRPVPCAKKTFDCTYIGGVWTNCKSENGKVVCYLDNHGLDPGTLCVDYYDYAPDADFADSNQLKVVPNELDIELVTGAGDNATTPDVTVYADLVSAVSNLATNFAENYIVNSCSSDATDKALSAAQGKRLYTAIAGKQDTLTFDSTPTANSDNPVKSGGVYTALTAKANSSDVTTALAGKQDSLTFDSSPSSGSSNPVTSGGIYTALAGKANASEVLDGAVLPEIEMQATEFGYWRTASPPAPSTSFGHHTPATPIPVGYDTIRMSMRLDKYIAGSDVTLFVFYSDVEGTQYLSSATLPIASATSYKGYYADYSAQIPAGAKSVSASDNCESASNAVHFRCYMFSSKSRKSELLQSQVNRKTRRMTTIGECKDGGYANGGQTAGALIPLRRYNHNECCCDILPVELGDSVYTKTRGAGYFRAWAFYDLAGKLVSIADSVENNTWVEATLTAPCTGYIAINHYYKNTTLDDGDTVLVRVNGYTDEETAPAVEDTSWQAVEPAEIFGKCVNTSRDLQDYADLSRIQVWPVTAGETVKLSIDWIRSSNSSDNDYVAVGSTTIDMTSYVFYNSADPTDWVAANVVGLYGGNISAISNSAQEVVSLEVPTGAVVLVCSGYAPDKGVRFNFTTNRPCTAYKLERLLPIRQERKKLKILCIGNSFTCDELGYLPYVLKRLAPDIDLTMRILYKGAATINHWYTNRTVESSSDQRYYEWKSFPGRWSLGITAGDSPDACFDADDWDIITLQQASDSNFDYDTVTKDALANMVYWLRVEKGFNGRIGWILTHAWNDTYTAAHSPATGVDTSAEMFELIVDNNEPAMSSGLVDFLIPSGTAVQNARNSLLATTAAYGVNSNNDNENHLYEGAGPMAGATAAAGAVLGVLPTSGYVHFHPWWRVPQMSKTNDLYTDKKSVMGIDAASQVISCRAAIAALQDPYKITTIS